MLELARQQVVDACRALRDRGLVVGTAGNVSVRVDDLVVISPSGVDYDEMSVADVGVHTLDGSPVEAALQPSSELPLHLAVYRARPDVRAIVHTHSPQATAWSFRGGPLTPAVEETRYYAIGEVRTSAPAPAGSDDLAATATAGLGEGKAVLLAGHGVIAVGADIGEADVVARSVEHQATIAWLLAGAAPAR